MTLLLLLLHHLYLLVPGLGLLSLLRLPRLLRLLHHQSLESGQRHCTTMM